MEKINDSIDGISNESVAKRENPSSTEDSRVVKCWSTLNSYLFYDYKNEFEQATIASSEHKDEFISKLQEHIVKNNDKTLIYDVHFCAPITRCNWFGNEDYKRMLEYLSTKHIEGFNISLTTHLLPYPDQVVDPSSIAKSTIDLFKGFLNGITFNSKLQIDDYTLSNENESCLKTKPGPFKSIYSSLLGLFGFSSSSGSKSFWDDVKGGTYEKLLNEYKTAKIITQKQEIVCPLTPNKDLKRQRPIEAQQTEHNDDVKLPNSKRLKRLKI